MTDSEEMAEDAPIESERSDRSGFVWGLVLGLVVGAAGALLLAPRPGRETRRRLRRQLESAKDQVGERLEHLETAVRREIRRRNRR
jgi:gas vesicle protein